MELTNYSYRESFIISLVQCEKCGIYYNKTSEPDHTCQTQDRGTQKIDIMQEISDNLNKVKPPKKKKK